MPGAGPLAAQVALVSGAGRGIGRELALGLAAAGARVGLLGRTRRLDVDAVLHECAALGARAVAVPADVADRDQAGGGRHRRARPRPGRPARHQRRPAGAGRPAPWEADPDDWWRVVETNLRGTFLLDRLVLPGDGRRGAGGCCTSAAAWASGAPDWSAYAVSKAAVAGSPTAWPRPSTARVSPCSR